ncbi:biosynthetic-type acetolactate synthase large subunit [Adhaeribacter aquaticus]|uniref:biosynthetic-type acetolactate synthase large subunit n=1 Tax=Adhaeribacter aquaticus TaxID=299567 RepID=UPI000405B0D4|nr:biosynthetic-type acetolactate synthase large subunit [Adhaeribacter aquaticus]
MSLATELTEKEIKTTTEKKIVTGAQGVLLSLLEEGVDTIFGYPGGAIMPIYDALYDFSDSLKHYLVRHEQGGIHAAQGYARITGRPGVCFATSGPGATNLITGIADAQIDSTPLVCITGQVFSHLLGTDAFQETDVIGVTMPVTKWSYQVTRAEEIPEAIAKAFYIASSGRPGPVLIDITKDAQNASFEFGYKKWKKIASYFPKPKLNLSAVQAAADLINQAKKPFILWGQGILLSHAEEEFKAFVEKAGIPAAWTILGLSGLPTEHPLNVGMLGMHGNYGPNLKTNEADVIIAIGMRFDDRVTGDLKRYAKQAKIIHIEIDQAEINKNVRATVAVNADAKEALQALTTLVEEKQHKAWVQTFKDCYEIEYNKVIRDKLYPSTDKLQMGEAIRVISEQTDGQAVLVTDVGQHQMMSMRYYNFKQLNSNITSGGAGTMGFCLPAAMGAKVGAPDRQVVAVIGDGGFQMTIQELGCIFQYQIGVKIVILNNNFLGMVRQWQQLFHQKRYSFTEMVNPDFVGISKAYGIEASKVTDRDNLQAEVKKMLEHDGPYLLEVVVETEENVFPMVPAGDSVANIRLE